MRIEVNIVNISFLILQYLFLNGNIRKSAFTGNAPLRFKAELSFICTAKGSHTLFISELRHNVRSDWSLMTNIREDPTHENAGRRFWRRKKRLNLLFVLPDEFYGPLSHWSRVMTFPPSSKDFFVFRLVREFNVVFHWSAAINESILPIKNILSHKSTTRIFFFSVSLPYSLLQRMTGCTTLVFLVYDVRKNFLISFCLQQ